jgi:hypothetical protein
LSKGHRKRFHHPLIVRAEGCCRSCLRSCAVRCIHTALVNGQSMHRWVGVSGDVWHSLHTRSCVHPRLARLLAVRILCLRRIQEKMRQLGSTFALQIGAAANFLYRPLNCIW